MSVNDPFEDKSSGFRKADVAGVAADTVPEAFSDPANPAAPVIENDAVVEQAPKFTDARKDIYARFNNRRAKEQNVNISMVDPLEIPEGVNMPEDEVNPPPLAPTPADIAREPAAVAPAKGSYTLKVNGNTFTVNREDLLRYSDLDESDAAGLPDVSLVRAAQINLAAQMRLDEAKQASLGARAASVPGNTQPEQQRAEVGQTKPQVARKPVQPTREEIEAIQLGDPEQAAAALDAWTERKLQADKDTTRQQQTFQSLQSDVDNAIADFGKANPDIASNEAAADVLRTFSVREALADIEKVVRLTDAERQDLLNNPTLITQAHNGARAQGLAVRKPAEIFAAAGARVRESMRMPAQQTTPPPAQMQLQPSRLDAKRALTSQPVRAGASDQIQRQPPEGAQPRRSVKETVALMKKARFQAV